MFIPEAMLASNFEDTKHPIEYFIENEWVIQEKSDGFRAIIAKQGDEIQIAGRTSGRTKKRSFYTDSCPEIVDFFKALPDNFILDAEMVSSDFNTLASKARTQKTVVYDPNFAINVFDMITWNEVEHLQRNSPHMKRFDHLKEFHQYVMDFHQTNGTFENPDKFFKVIKQAQKPITSQAYLDKALSKITGDGGEGLIIKNPRAGYQPGKRSKDWLKVLPYREIDVVFHDVFKGQGKYSETLGGLKAVLLTDWEKTGDIVNSFGVGTGFTDAMRTEIFEFAHRLNALPIAGKICYKELQPSGIPRMPVFLSFNPDKEI